MSGLGMRILPPLIEVTDPIKDTTTEPSGVLVNKTLDLVYTTPGDFRFVGIAIGFLVILLGSTGNGITIWAYARNKNLQTSFNVLIANLCCLELLFSVLIIPLQLPGYFIQRSPYPEGVCSTIGYFYYSSMAASLQNLVAIAINRYVGIVDTKRYQKLFTGARLRFCVIAIWILPLLLYLPVVAGGLITWDNLSMRCSITKGFGPYPIRIYNTLLNVVYQAGGLILLIVLYTAIMRKVNQVQKKLKMHKKASFKSTVKYRKKQEASIHHNGYQSSHTNTSGDEAIDDFRPSSLISGGFQFRPAKDAKQLDWLSDSAHGSDHELNSKKVSEQISYLTGSDELSPKPQRRRSLWKTLFKSKNTLDIDQNQNFKSSEMDNATHDRSSAESMSPGPASPKEEVEKEKVETEVVRRNMDQDRKDVRRKKSLSAPTLPSMDEIINQSRKNSAAVAQNVPEKVNEEKDHVDDEDDSPRLHRAFTVGGRYRRNLPPKILISQHSTNMEQTINLSNKLHESKKRELTNSMPTLCAASHTETTPTKTLRGTIARKIRDHKRSKRRSKSDRQRERALRKRHARERQLAYSSFAICIAFAVCILPTALLHLALIFGNIKIPASIVLIVGCISWLHAVTNPIIYGYMNHLYRSEYDRIARELEKKVAKCFR